MASILSKRSSTKITQCCTSRAPWITSKRFLSLHEYQAQKLLSDYKVNVPAGKVATSPDEVAAAVSGFGGAAVLKSQILAGGRGKGSFDTGLKSGVHVVSE